MYDVDAEVILTGFHKIRFVFVLFLCEQCVKTIDLRVGMAVNVDEQNPAVGLFGRLGQSFVTEQVGKTDPVVADASTESHVGRQRHTAARYRATPDHRPVVVQDSRITGTRWHRLHY